MEQPTIYQVTKHLKWEDKFQVLYGIGARPGKRTNYSSLEDLAARISKQRCPG